MSSPTSRSWPRIPSSAHGRSPRTSMSSRPARGSGRTSGRSRPVWRPFWTPVRRPCTRGSAACPCPRRSRSPGAVTEAVRAQGRRVLLGSGWADLALVDDRDDCFLVGEVNQQALFRRVAAAVHHGGAGTTTTAAQAGAPQVIVPQLADQPYWAGRVAELGIGAAHDGPRPTRRVALGRSRDRPGARNPRHGEGRVRGDPHRRGGSGRRTSSRRRRRQWTSLSRSCRVSTPTGLPSSRTSSASPSTSTATAFATGSVAPTMGSMPSMATLTRSAGRACG